MVELQIAHRMSIDILWLQEVRLREDSSGSTIMLWEYYKKLEQVRFGDVGLRRQSVALT